jgi:hypothetical protein
MTLLFHALSGTASLYSVKSPPWRNFSRQNAAIRTVARGLPASPGKLYDANALFP